MRSLAGPKRQTNRSTTFNLNQTSFLRADYGVTEASLNDRVVLK